MLLKTFPVSTSISIHALREEGDEVRAVPQERATISIHALREEGDPPKAGLQAPHGDFYPRPPRGGRHERHIKELYELLFLSTPSARRATFSDVQSVQHAQISIHALREEGDKPLLCFHQPKAISIHALREEGDVTSAADEGGAPISIHALREEGDCCPLHWASIPGNFYPRPPRGGRPSINLTGVAHLYFYPRPPRGGRPMAKGSVEDKFKFLSTPSARRATHAALGRIGGNVFLSTPSARRATR